MNGDMGIDVMLSSGGKGWVQMLDVCPECKGNGRKCYLCSERGVVPTRAGELICRMVEQWLERQDRI